MVFANLYKRIGDIEARLNDMSPVQAGDAGVASVNIENFDNKLGELDTKVVAVQGQVADMKAGNAEKVSALEQELAGSVEKISQLTGVLASVMEQVNALGASVNQLSEHIQNA